MQILNFSPVKIFNRTPFILTFLLIICCAFVKAQNAGDLVIAEVGADPTLTEPANEYFVICNRTLTAFNLNGFTVTDNGVTTITLPNWNLAGNSCVIVANSSIDFSATGYNCSGTPANLITPSSWFAGNLSNTADRLGLFDTTAMLIDGVSYGGDTTYLNPSAADVFNNSGATLIRTGYPTDPSTLPDTNTNADWTSRVGTPCDAPLAPTAASAQVGGRVADSNGNGISKVLVKISGGDLSEPLYAMTGPFGYYNFEVPVGQTYFVTVNSKNYSFSNPTRVITVNDNVTDLDFTANER